MCLERRQRIAACSLAVFAFCVALVIVFNVYLLSMHDVIVAETVDIPPSLRHVNSSLLEQLTMRWKNLQSEQKWNVAVNVHGEPRRELEPTVTATTTNAVRLWRLAGDWVQPRQIYPKKPRGLTDVLRALHTQPIIKAEVFKRGTQLKVLLVLSGGQKAIMKPMRSSRETVFLDTPYSGADRHNGEIAAYHLSRLLDFRWCPLTSGRVVNLKREILPVADKPLSNTFFQKGDSTCFYGVCHYCRRDDPVCAPKAILEAAVIMWLPAKYRLKQHRHPWARTYKTGIKTEWEQNDNYCQQVKKMPPYDDLPRLLDLIDVAIFDFLIGNADRHRYETFEKFSNGSVILLDNGKSFGNPYEDEVSILAPLYQCCIVRASTMKTLQQFAGRTLSSSLESLLKTDPLYPILTKAHLEALDRRRYKALDAIAWCRDGHANVLKSEV